MSPGSEKGKGVGYDHDHNGEIIGRYNVTEKLYPEMSVERNTIKEFHLLPDQLGAIYTEAAKALYSNQPVLSMPRNHRDMGILAR
jgi:hypothetical protein